MKGMLIFLYCNILMVGINGKYLRLLQQSSTNQYSYSDYLAVSTNNDLSNSNELKSQSQDESVVYITTSDITISDSILTKESGDSSNIENSEFYGVNAAVLVQGGELKMTGGKIITKAKGSNALCATNNGKVTISGTEIESTADSSARGLHATYGGNIIATNVKISSSGGSCATLATDRGEGTVSCSSCNLSTSGKGSPLIYSTGVISISQTTGTSTGAQAVVVEGKNTATITENSELKCYGYGNNGDDNNQESKVDKCGVMLYQSMSGDADSGTSTFNCDNSKIEIINESSVSTSAPMFFITNTDAVINLKECTFTYNSNIFLTASGTSGTSWGTYGSNGGVVSLNLENQEIEGNFVVDATSGLTINLIKSKITGIINGENTAAKLSITLDSDSSITLTGNSFFTSIINAKDDGTNLINDTFTWTKSEEKTIERSTGNIPSNQNENHSNDPNNQNNPPNPPDNQGGNPPDNQGGNPPDIQGGNPPDGQGRNTTEGQNISTSNGEDQSSPKNSTNNSNSKYLKISFLLIFIILF